MSAQDIATNFLQLVARGEIDQAFDQYIDPTGKHHNVHTPAGMAALREGMKQAETAFPHKEMTIQQVVAGEERVVIYSHLVMKPGEMDMAVVHMFRVEGGKIVEMWDCGQVIPTNSPNSDGAF
jgi:predicted SnoaL-like aldol condensation-catalyzing enzyme